MTSPAAPRADADVIVIGAGHNALICAGYLAAAGLEVLVLEARDIVGGDTVTEELTLPGFQHDTCSSAHVVLQSNPVIRDDELGLLARYGLRYVCTDPAFVMPVDDSAVVVSRDVDATAEQLARWSTEDAAALREMMARWHGGLAGAHARYSAGLPPTGEPADLEYQELRSSSAWDVVHRTFHHPISRALMTWLAFATITPPHRPGTGALPAAITSGRLRFGWATPIGGSGALPAALLAQLADHGATVLTSSPVRRILTSAGRATGVLTEDGRRYLARRAVVSSAHLAVTASMVDGAEPADLRRAAASWRPGLALFAVHVALRADISYPTSPGPDRAVAGALGTPAGLSRQVQGCFQGLLERDAPWLLIVNSTVVDPNRAPNGGGILKLLTTAPSRLAGGREWDEQTATGYAEHLLELVSRRVRGADTSSVLATAVESPAHLARRNPHNLGGSCHGGEFDLGNGTVIPGWLDHRGELAGLYYTGSTTHPGGSVSGRPGRNTAHRVLVDLGIDPATVMSTP
ncbi:MAG TPA: NAD(P)/FAD-dependent oxidoreductase [Micromonosporaceae bacterium]